MHQMLSSKHFAGQEYLLNLIDTPGHVDFSSEVSRSLLACQGVILLVDANQGVQAQTVSNFYLAFANDLVIVPVLNKVHPLVIRWYCFIFQISILRTHAQGHTNRGTSGHPKVITLQGVPYVVAEF